MDENQKKACCNQHPMYEKLLCDNTEGHIGLHKANYQGELLRWGVPSQEEMYNVKRTK